MCRAVVKLPSSSESRTSCFCRDRNTTHVGFRGSPNCTNGRSQFCLARRLQHLRITAAFASSRLVLRCIAPMSGGAYTNKPERRIRHLKDVLTNGPRTFDAVIIGAGETSVACRSIYKSHSSCFWPGSQAQRACRCGRLSNMQSLGIRRTNGDSARASPGNWYGDEFEKQ